MMRMIHFMLLVFTFSSVYGLSYVRYSLFNGYYTKFDGIGRDHKGNVYIAGGKYGDAAVFKYSPDIDSIRIVGTVRQASINAMNWFSDDIPGKIHTSIYEHPDGRMFFASHSADEGLDYSGFRGGHVYSYHPDIDTFVDESAPGVGIPHQGIMDVALAKRQNIVYSIGYPDGDIYKLDLETKTSSLLINSGSHGGGVSRYMFADNNGWLYYPKGIYFLAYNPDADSFGVKGLGLSNTNQISCLVKSFNEDTIYFINHGDYHLTRYVPATNSVTILGSANIDSVNRTIATLAIRWDLNTLYYAPDSYGKLVSWNLTTNEKKAILNIPVTYYTGSNGVDKNGDIFFSTIGSGSLYIYKFILDTPCIICSTGTSVEKKSSVNTDNVFQPLHNSPNPFNPSTTISYSVVAHDRTNVTLCIYSPSGFLVKRLVDGNIEKGKYTISWKGTDEYNRAVGSGRYVCRLTVGRKSYLHSLMLIR